MHDQELETPLGIKSPKVIFVNSMSDLFHKDVPFDFIRRVFDVMTRATWHQFQILTKRADRLAEVASWLPWPANVWMGVSIEKREFLDRMECLKSTKAKVKFLSLEPLLKPLRRLDLDGIDWVIVGRHSQEAERSHASGRTWDERPQPAAFTCEAVQAGVD